MKYLSGRSILRLATQLVGNSQEFMTSLVCQSAEEYSQAWSKYLGDRLEKEVTVSFSCDNWHISIRS